MPRRGFVWPFIKSNLRFKVYCMIFAIVLVGTFHAFHADGAERAVSDSIKATAPTNQMTLDAVVADVLERNPELSFYNAEIAAAKGQARTAAAWANPEISATAGDKRVTGGGLATEGVAWSVSVRQTFESLGVIFPAACCAWDFPNLSDFDTPLLAAGFFIGRGASRCGRLSQTNRYKWPS